MCKSLEFNLCVNPRKNPGFRKSTKKIRNSGIQSRASL